MKIVPETPEHASAVRKLLVDAFGGDAEAALVEGLRADGDVVVALVAEDPLGAVIGHIVLSRLKSPPHALALAPLAVDPQHQRRGIGAALVREALRRAGAVGEAIVFVLGDPAYYGRFGFSRERASHFSCRWSGEHFTALLLDGHAPAQADVVYASAFDRLC